MTVKPASVLIPKVKITCAGCSNEYYESETHELEYCPHCRKKPCDADFVEDVYTWAVIEPVTGDIGEQENRLEQVIKAAHEGLFKIAGAAGDTLIRNLAYDTLANMRKAGEPNAEQSNPDRQTNEGPGA